MNELKTSKPSNPSLSYIDDRLGVQIEQLQNLRDTLSYMANGPKDVVHDEKSIKESSSAHVIEISSKTERIANLVIECNSLASKIRYG